MNYHIGKDVSILNNLIRRKVNMRTSSLSITSKQSRIIGFIFMESQKRDIFQRDIEEEFNIRRSSVTSLLQTMEKNDLIMRESVNQDARLKKIILTPKAIKIHDQVIEILNEVEEEFHEALSKEEYVQFKKIMDRLISTAKIV
ncbi:MAG: winged helix-turn-helix transcriptional regulator [Erysipelotrichaceae bacterium]|nr:winged helix-turn-helix transcriptional regulator [Erysipelotrichaceae bacterium]